jgi:hypothetical protein
MIALLDGCASTAPKASYSHDLVSHYRIDADDVPHVQVDSKPGVEIADVDKQRISAVIVSKLDVRCANNPPNNDAKDCLVAVTITRYQKGNAFARAMVAGLGQIHIDADVKITASATNEKIADFTVAKTFAWGGIYGAATVKITSATIYYAAESPLGRDTGETTS